MKEICREIFRAIHEGKWLKIEYRNKAGELTNYWIGIRNLNAERRSLEVEGLHLGMYQIKELMIYVDSIQSAVLVEGTYYPVNQELVNDISDYPEKYADIFKDNVNLKILTYLEMCNRMDSVPYFDEYSLIKYMDRDTFCDGEYQLSPEQFREVVKNFSVKADKKKTDSSGKLKIKQLAMNVISLHTKRGLYPLAYRKLDLDVKRHAMRPEETITICSEFQLDGGVKESIRKYLDADSYELLYDFEKNQEKIKDSVTENSGGRVKVDDMPYVIGIGKEIILDLHKEYQAILSMYEEDKVTAPIKAFFGELLSKPRRQKTYPIALVDNKINLDQLLAINKGMMYPTAYIQGPPGTGKTNTIINTLVTAFFNERTVLFASYNNHPINGVFEKLCALTYRGRKIPFPVLRLGNNEKVAEALVYIRELVERVSDVSIYEETLDKRRDRRIERAKQLSQLLKDYEVIIDLNERKETLKRLTEYTENSAAMLPFNSDLRERQLYKIEDTISKRKPVTEETALELLDRNEEEFLQYLYFTSAKYIQRLKEEKFRELREILEEPDEQKAGIKFNKYLSVTENVKKLQRVFPIILTTCISAHKIGQPGVMFDMVIMDEASQCNTAMSLVPILRGENLMLVGDPQQLNPVILLDELTNRKLMNQYHITQEYDYRKNSVYKTFLASDSVSDEILLRSHYRCDPRIIGFNNKKYYNSLLEIKAQEKDPNPLIFVNVKNDRPEKKNSSSEEAEKIVSYVSAHKDKKIGIITPFVNQKELIDAALKREGLDKQVTCGTVHSFQGDEKDVVLFSTAIGQGTGNGTYGWLKSNQELLNVATSRAKEKLIVLADSDNVKRLHENNKDEDDFFELCNYVKEEGKTVVTPKETNSRALGIKPFSTETEEAFMQSLTHALENIWLQQSAYSVKKEVAISQVFEENVGNEKLFYTGRFDFVVYEKSPDGEFPILAIELDGKEHLTDAAVKRRDEQKNKICREHNLQLIRVDNTYARRYNFIKQILINYFNIRH